MVACQLVGLLRAAFRQFHRCREEPFGLIDAVRASRRDQAPMEFQLVKALRMRTRNTDELKAVSMLIASAMTVHGYRPGLPEAAFPLDEVFREFYSEPLRRLAARANLVTLFAQVHSHFVKFAGAAVAGTLDPVAHHRRILEKVGSLNLDQGTCLSCLVRGMASFLRSLRSAVRSPLHDQFDVVIASGIGMFFAVMLFCKRVTIEDCIHHLPNLECAKQSRWGLKFGRRLRFRFEELITNGVRLCLQHKRRLRDCSGEHEETPIRTECMPFMRRIYIPVSSPSDIIDIKISGLVSDTTSVSNCPYELEALMNESPSQEAGIVDHRSLVINTIDFLGVQLHKVFK
ncbi:hypothetical protein NEMBOFW57_006229 [Staphylotrichum longicolle]|uniref:Uncharacterized protein n=1 Tax=Staphylotrichum longicolle TaxID=669026 RepID=A0AAD4F1P2_9PEZI|nr:hypothetical protein NEMBOFW57_006229 [Staphylotrichum longicolle]